LAPLLKIDSYLIFFFVKSIYTDWDSLSLFAIFLYEQYKANDIVTYHGYVGVTNNYVDSDWLPDLFAMEIYSYYTDYNYGERFGTGGFLNPAVGTALH
jgi:hypothetical protein